jgi:hypothetical protein
MQNRLKLLTAALLLLLAAAPHFARVCAQTHAALSVAQTPPPIVPQPTPYPATVVGDASPRAGWRRYQFGDNPAFSVVMPTQPEASAERTPSPGAPAMVVHLYTSTNDTGVYGAARLDGLPINIERSTEAERQGFFKNFAAGFVNGFQESLKKNNLNYELKLHEPRKVTAAGYEGFEQDLTVGPFRGRTQLVFVGKAAFCVMSIWNQDAPAADREAYFASFRLAGTPKSD